MDKYKITYQGIEIEIEQLPNGKFKIPPLGQFTKHGLGSTWLDDGRIPYESGGTIASNPKLRVEGGYKTETGDRVFCQGELGEKNTMVENTLTGGRFPANLLVSDDVLNDGKISKPTGRNSDIQSNGIFGKFGNYSDIKDSGSFSRYFDLDKWWEERIKQLPASVQKTFPFLIVPKASKSEKNRGCEDLPEKPVAERAGRDNTMNSKYTLDGKPQSISPPERNNHPTVKPLKLMSYLITLGSREGDIVLDPFLGSGTTTLACQLLTRQCIGIEINKEYYEIAVGRCSQKMLV